MFGGTTFPGFFRLAILVGKRIACRGFDLNKQAPENAWSPSEHAVTPQLMLGTLSGLETPDGRN